MAIGLGRSLREEDCEGCSDYYNRIVELQSCLNDIKFIINDNKMTDAQKLVELNTLLKNQK